MSSLTVLPWALTGLVVSAADKAPEAEDVKAGWLAFGIFLALLVTVALLGRSLARQLRKAQAAEDAGLYDPSRRKPRTVLPVDQPPEAAGSGRRAEEPPAEDGPAEPPERPVGGTDPRA